MDNSLNKAQSYILNQAIDELKKISTLRGSFFIYNVQNAPSVDVLLEEMEQMRVIITAHRAAELEAIERLQAVV